MATRVGPKGQVVIEKEIREKLGVEPGSLALQQVVGDHVEIRFVPASHRRSLKGVLQPYIRRCVSEQEWHEVRDAAWGEAMREETEGWE